MVNAAFTRTAPWTLAAFLASGATFCAALKVQKTKNNISPEKV